MTQLGEQAREDQNAVEQLGSDEELLAQYAVEVDKMLDSEQSRKESVEARLTSIVGLTSIAATIVLSGLIALAVGPQPVAPLLVTCIVTFGILYLVFQLVDALFSAVGGLSRAGYLAGTSKDMSEEAASALSVRLRGANITQTADAS